MPNAEETKHLDELVSKFLETENALKVALEAAERLSTARESLGETSSGIYRLTSELKDIARNLGDSAMALRALNPNDIFTRLETTNASIDVLQNRVRRVERMSAVIALFIIIQILITIFH